MTDAPSLSYLIAHPGGIGITFLRPLALGLLLFVPLFHLRRQPRRPRASLLRSFCFVAVVVVLAGLRLTARLPDSRLTVVAAVDVSESIDGGGRTWEQDYLNEVASALAPGDQLAVVTFAADTRLVRGPTTPAPLRELPPPRSLTATDLTRAIEGAVALFPPDTQRRLLLITDGNETRGDARDEIAELRASRVRLDAIVPPHRNDPDVSVDKLVIAPIVGEDSVVPLRVVAHNSGQLRPAVLTLLLDGSIVDSAAVELQPGLNSLEFPTQVNGQGSHLLCARLEVPDDPTPGNNFREIGITIRGKTRVLLITPRGRSPLALALRHKGFEPEVATPDQFPARLEDLLTYHGVILEDVTSSGISRAALDTLERYVREFGGGLVVAGGANTFGDQGFLETSLKHLLPLTLEPRRPRRGTREPLALFLVIDRSNSMGYNSRIGTLRDGEKLRYAKEAALAVVRQLKDQDLVGVIAFDSQPHEISPLEPLRENRAKLESLIPRLVENGGTDFYDALVAARSQLAASRVSRRHVVLLTDGDTNRAALDEYRDLIAGISHDKISVTTIRIGDNTVNLQLLQDISRETGGEFHHVENAEMLPDLMLRDATRALSPFSHGSEAFFPQVGSRSQVLRGIQESDMPPLAGYAYARPKEGAEVLLSINRLERRDPLLAIWHYGLGRVAAYAASPSDDAEAWLGWTEFSKFWSQLTRWTARTETEDEYVVEAHRRDGSIELTVRTFGPAADDAVLVARLQVDDDTSRKILLAPQEPRLFRAVTPDLPGGQYPLTIVQRNPLRDVSERTELITIPDADEEPQEEQQRSEPNMSLLTQLTQATGGKINPTARELVDRPQGSRLSFYPLDSLLIPLAMLAFLGDVAVRRLHLERRAPDQLATRLPA